MYRPKFRHTAFGTRSFQQLLNVDAGRPEGGNIGSRGEHLTIAFQLETGGYTERLLHSIETAAPAFKGEVLILYNTNQLLAVGPLRQQADASQFRVRFACCDRRSEAVLRNFAARTAMSPWLLWLAPTVRMTWDIVPSLQEDIDQLACCFLTVPAVNPRSRVCFPRVYELVPPSDDQLFVHLHPEPLPEGGPFFGTAMAGDACLFHIESFWFLDGYDERLTGLEDLEFSLRLFQSGYLVGVASQCGIEKQAEAKDEDNHTAIVRPAGSSSALANFEKKFGLTAARPPEGSGEGSTPPGAWGSWNLSTCRPKIALIVDVDYWAFANIARQLVRCLGDRFNFEIIPVSVVNDLSQIFMLCEPADLIHFFWREDLRSFYEGYHTPLQDKGMQFNQFCERFVSNKIKTTAIYDHLFLSNSDILQRQQLFSKWCDSYYVCSHRLYEIYTGIPGYRMPDAILPDGVDLNVFHPTGLERFQVMGDRPIIVGWVGNSKWAAEHLDSKGVHTILRPALRNLAAQGVAIVEHFADREVRMIAHRDMPRYYSEIDILVCASEIEGTPNPVLEAMACGVPVITTDVGVVPQALGERQRQFILPTRSVEALELAIRKLDTDRSLFATLSQENLVAIRQWDWALMAEGFAKFFGRALALRNR